MNRASKIQLKTVGNEDLARKLIFRMIRIKLEEMYHRNASLIAKLHAPCGKGVII
jgi:hypothetical protein